MRPISKQAQKTFKKLTAPLRDKVDGYKRHSHKWDTSPSFMAVCVERISADSDPVELISIAHYYEQNGDMMRDPDVVYWKAPDGRVYPTEYRQDSLGIHQSLILFGDSKPIAYNKAAQRDAATFTTQWFRNITQQQDLERLVTA